MSSVKKKAFTRGPKFRINFFMICIIVTEEGKKKDNSAVTFIYSSVKINTRVVLVVIRFRVG